MPENRRKSACAHTEYTIGQHVNQKMPARQTNIYIYIYIYIYIEYILGRPVNELMPARETALKIRNEGISFSL
jgi:hypothetical protein